jgi:hydrogenase-4 component F
VTVLLALVLVPASLALVALVLPWPRARSWLVPLGGAAHLALFSQMALTTSADATAFGGWLVLDGLGRLFLGLASVLFAISSVYAVGYLGERSDRDNRIFTACILAFLANMTVMIEAHHLGLMWIALEACTLSSGPLIYFNRSPRALEALWKYLLLGSVGVAVALLGSLFLAYGALRAGLPPSLLFEDLVREAPALSRPWLHTAFILLFVGYGTKMGLAPMHTWKPDAYGEAPGVVGALLAGGLTSCAFLAVLRFFKICVAAGDAVFAREMMIAAGLLSMAVAGVFMARQHDYKRMLAYSSVEHMGILVIGVAIGGGATFGALLHLVNNALTKGVLFLSAGNLHRVYASKRTEHVSGALRRAPLSGGLFLMGFFAITGSPPFGPFQSEFTIVRATFERGHYLVAGLFLLALAVVFMGMASTVLAVVLGRPPETGPASRPALPTPGQPGRRETFLTVAPILVFAALVVALGLHLPGPLDGLLREAAGYVEATSPAGAPVLARAEPAGRRLP